MCTVFPTNKQNHPRVILPNDIKRPMRNPPNDINRPTRNPPNETNCPHAICPNEAVGAAPACPPERPRSSVSIQKIGLCITHCARGMNDGCALVGRHGRAHRHRPYQSPSYFSTQSYTNKRTIYMQSAQRKSTVPRVIHPNEIVGAAPVCPRERPRSGVSIREMGFVHYALCAGIERWMRPCRATRAGTQAPPLPISIIFFHTSHTNKITIYTQSNPTKP